jgi:hypothetical protein
MTKEQKDQLAKLLVFVMESEEGSFENTVDKYGVESDQAKDHMYSLARDIWVEHELDLP